MSCRKRSRSRRNSFCQFHPGFLIPSYYFGVDEVGRGCLCGPVVAACVGAPSLNILAELQSQGLTDSKKLKLVSREKFMGQILALNLRVGWGWASHTEIDRYNIRVASLLAMFRAIAHALGVATWEIGELRPVPFAAQEVSVAKQMEDALGQLGPSHVFVDGRDTLNDWLPHTHTSEGVIQGDSRVPLISAASVVAKVARDDWMHFLDIVEPSYGLRQHKGYATADHISVIREKGPSRWQRQSFRVSTPT